MVKTRDKVTYTLDEIASLLGVESWEKIADRNPDAWGDYYLHAHREAKEAGLSDEEAETKALEAESEARNESYSDWKSAMESVAETIFEQHKLTLVQLKTKPWLYKVVPLESWSSAASCLVDTINGVGYFEFKDAKALADSIPTTMRGAVLGHLHWMKDRSEVYGESSPTRLMEMRLR